jgi:hypothetical protein
MKIVHEIIDLGKGTYGQGFIQIDPTNLLKIYDDRNTTTGGGSGGSSGGSTLIQGHIIKDGAGNIMTQQPNLRFNRMTITNDNVNNQTIVTRPPSVVLSTIPPLNPLQGDEWINSITWKTYVYYDDFWVEEGRTGSGSINSESLNTFINLTDTPISYSGKAGKFTAVNDAETGLEFKDISILAPDGLVNIGTTTQSTNSIIYGINWQWRINQILYLPTNPIEITFPSSDLGFLRLDLVVGNNLGQIIRVPGTTVADDQPLILPTPPAGTIPLQEVYISNAGITSFTNFSLATFVRFDINNQNLSLTQRQNARTNIQSVSKDVSDLITSPLWRFFDEVKNVEVFSMTQGSQGSERLYTLRMRNDTGTIVFRLLNGVTQNGRGNQFARFYLRGDSLSTRSLVSWHNSLNNPIFAMEAGGVSEFYISAPIQPRSSTSDRSVRRDELYLNYNQILLSNDPIVDLTINVDCKLLILTGSGDLTGIVGEQGRLLRIEARGGDRIIRHENIASLVANRFSIISDLTINNGEIYTFLYTNSRWRRVL